METGGKQRRRRRRRAQKSDDRIVVARRTVDGIKSSMEQGGRRRLATAVANGRSWRRSDNCYIIGMVSLLPGSSSSRSRNSGGGGIASMSPESYYDATPSQKSPRRPYRLRNLITGCNAPGLARRGVDIVSWERTLGDALVRRRFVNGQSEDLQRARFICAVFIVVSFTTKRDTASTTRRIKTH